MCLKFGSKIQSFSLVYKNGEKCICKCIHFFSIFFIPSINLFMAYFDFSVKILGILKIGNFDNILSGKQYLFSVKIKAYENTSVTGNSRNLKYWY